MGYISVRWVAIHTEYGRPHLFVDLQESGPSLTGITAIDSLMTGQGGTVLRDEVEYCPPLGALGALGAIGSLLAGWLIRRERDRMFTFRRETTCRLIQSVEWEAETNSAANL